MQIRTGKTGRLQSELVTDILQMGNRGKTLRDRLMCIPEREETMSSKVLELSSVRFPQVVTQEKPLYEKVKRSFDLCMSLCALIVLWPLFLLIAVLVYSEDKGPAIYKHKRIGRDGQEIYLYKFRTMKNNCPLIEEIFTEEQMKQWKENFKVDNDPRITKVGNFLRKTSLDELPQLLNIIRGDMSIVGPRPVTQEETEKYGVHRALFLSVMPGLTGYWQANGRSATTYEQRMEMELYYVRNCKFTMDLQIIFQTVAAVLKREGAI